MDLSQRIEAVIEKVMASEGYGVVRVQVSGNLRKTLQIMIERLDQKSIAIEDCEAVSRLVSPLLDVENVIEEAYNLEVSSPGIDRPLVKPKHFEQFQGHAVSIVTNFPIKNRKKFQGTLAFASKEGIRIVLAQPAEDGSLEVEMSYEDIRSARLHVEF